MLPPNSRSDLRHVFAACLFHTFALLPRSPSPLITHISYSHVRKSSNTRAQEVNAITIAQTTAQETSHQTLDAGFIRDLSNAGLSRIKITTTKAKAAISNRLNQANEKRMDRKAKETKEAKNRNGNTARNATHATLERLHTQHQPGSLTDLFMLFATIFLLDTWTSTSLSS